MKYLYFINLLLAILFIKHYIEIYLLKSEVEHDSTDRLLFKIYKGMNLFFMPQFLIIPRVLKNIYANELLVSIISVIIFGLFRSTFPNYGFLSFNLCTDLNTNIYGQESAVSHLSKLLQHPNETIQRCKDDTKFYCDKYSGLQVIVLSGGPGTGKSFIAFKIKKHYSLTEKPNNILHNFLLPEIVPLSEKNLQDTKLNILNLVSGFSLIIIDSIKPTDNYIHTYLKELSLFTERHKVDVTVILVVKTINVLSYNNIIGVDSFQKRMEYNKYMKTLTDQFVNQVLKPIPNINYNVILLEALSVNDVKKCMEENNESDMSNNYKWNIVLQNSKDRDFVMSGCKAVV